MDPLPYLTGYPADLQAQARALRDSGRLGAYLRQRYPEAHDVRNDRQLLEYVQALKARHMRQSPPLHRVAWDTRLEAVRQALGIHASVSRVHGGRLRSSREIRIASVFREAPAAFLEMIVVHELAHLREREHNRAFYKLCTHMAPDYHQLEFDLRLYLLERDRAT